MKTKLLIYFLAAAILFNGCSSSEITEENGSETITEAVNPPPQPTEDIVPTPVTPVQETFSAKNPYGNTKRYIEVLGLKEYDSLGSGNMKDTPSEGNIFLVLFLQIENRTDNTDYINPYYVFANIDGIETENTALLNDPEGYKTVFSDVEPQGSIQGIIVWEVPKNWKEFKLNFNNWVNTDHLELFASFTKDDLKDPVPAKDRGELR